MLGESAFKFLINIKPEDYFVYCYRKQNKTEVLNWMLSVNNATDILQENMSAASIFFYKIVMGLKLNYHLFNVLA